MIAAPAMRAALRTAALFFCIGVGVCLLLTGLWKGSAALGWNDFCAAVGSLFPFFWPVLLLPIPLDASLSTRESVESWAFVVFVNGVMYAVIGVVGRFVFDTTLAAEQKK